jgi:hypothetical protein
MGCAEKRIAPRLLGCSAREGTTPLGAKSGRLSVVEVAVIPSVGELLNVRSARIDPAIPPTMTTNRNDGSHCWRLELRRFRRAGVAATTSAPLGAERSTAPKANEALLRLARFTRRRGGDWLLRVLGPPSSPPWRVRGTDHSEVVELVRILQRSRDPPLSHLGRQNERRACRRSGYLSVRTLSSSSFWIASSKRPSAAKRAASPVKAASCAW